MASLTQTLHHGDRIHTAVLLQQFYQHRLYTRFALACRQMQNPQVLLVRPHRLTRTQHIVGHAEVAAGEHLRLVTIVGKRPWLADQPVDHMTVIDAMLASTTQTRHLVTHLLGIPHFHMLGVETHLHLLTD